MKLGSEEQRQELLELLGTITFQVTADTIDQTHDKIQSILGPIRNAEIEIPEDSDAPTP